MNRQRNESPCCHDDAPFASRRGGKPIPDETVVCPGCGERVAFARGEVATVRETNKRLELDRKLFEEAQRLIREDDWDGLAEFAGRNREERAVEAARRARGQ